VPCLCSADGIMLGDPHESVQHYSFSSAGPSRLLAA
jgi:hypothetical protein